MQLFCLARLAMTRVPVSVFVFLIASASVPSVIILVSFSQEDIVIFHYGNEIHGLCQEFDIRIMWTTLYQHLVW